MTLKALQAHLVGRGDHLVAALEVYPQLEPVPALWADGHFRVHDPFALWAGGGGTATNVTAGLRPGEHRKRSETGKKGRPTERRRGGVLITRRAVRGRRTSSTNTKPAGVLSNVAFASDLAAAAVRFFLRLQQYS